MRYIVDINCSYFIYSDITTANGCALIFVYMTYTMLPVRLREALVGGLLLSGTLIYLSINRSASTTLHWSEVSCINFHFIKMLILV